jgi:hypothetical protein
VRGRGDNIRPAPGGNAWYREQAGWADARGAGVTGMVILDGIGFQLEGAGKLPAGMTIEPGGAMAAWYQTDPDTIDGYPPGGGPGQ